MRLFGTPGGSLDTARATYFFMPPFDLAIVAVESGFLTGSGGIATPSLSGSGGIATPSLSGGGISATPGLSGIGFSHNGN